MAISYYQVVNIPIQVKRMWHNNTTDKLFYMRVTWIDGDDDSVQGYSYFSIAYSGSGWYCTANATDENFSGDTGSQTSLNFDQVYFMQASWKRTGATAVTVTAAIYDTPAKTTTKSSASANITWPSHTFYPLSIRSETMVRHDRLDKGDEIVKDYGPFVYYEPDATFPSTIVFDDIGQYNYGEWTYEGDHEKVDMFRKDDYMVHENDVYALDETGSSGSYSGAHSRLLQQQGS
jgi:hypothetical protein